MCKINVVCLSFCLCLYLCLVFCTISATEQELDIAVYYEALCPDSVRFIKTQLYPFLVTEGFLQFTNLKLVPYGKVGNWTNPDTNEISLYCQHGEQECELNALHACIIEQNPIIQQLEMVNCMMGRRSAGAANECATKLNIDVSAAQQCKNSRTTVDILQKYGLETNALELSFVPSIAFNNRFDPWEQMSIFYNFPRSFCKAYTKTYQLQINDCQKYL